MSPEIRHFLVLYDIGAASAKVQRFDDYEEAVAAYSKLEEDLRDRKDVDIVLLSADSIETIRRTHSSYFETRESFERLLPAGALRVAV